MVGTFSELHPGHPQENKSNFRVYILRLSETYWGPAEDPITKYPK